MTTIDAGTERVRFFPRQLVKADDLNQDQAYHRERLREHNRFLHGWGVVCGGDVTPSPTTDRPWQVKIERCYLVTPPGDAIWIRAPALFDLASAFLQTDDPCAVARPCPPVPHVAAAATRVYLAVQYVECQSRPVRVAPIGCGCDDAECEYSRFRDGYEFSCLSSLPLTHTAPAPPVDVDALRKQQLTPPYRDGPLDPWVVLATIELPQVQSAPVTKVDSTAGRRLLHSTKVIQFIQARVP